MKHGCIFLIAFVFCSFSHSQMYRCVDPGVRISFSDMPCDGSTEVKLAPAQAISPNSWKDQLKLKKTDGIWILDMVTSAGETTINYKFTHTTISNEFMKLINELSGFGMAMSHMKIPVGKTLGQARVVVGKDVTVL